MMKIELPEIITPPNYQTLLDWWDSWSDSKVVHYDFWARGNFTKRILSRNHTGRAACIVRAEYLDEIESAFKRLALLDLDVDVAWYGEVAKPQLAIVPQDIDYEGVGGWGYSACSGDRYDDKRGGKEWCPSIGWASLLPDSVVDWLADEASEFVRSGNIIVAPAKLIGLTKRPGGKSENQLQRVSNSLSIMNQRASIDTLFSFELPYLEGMSIRDTAKFCNDNKDSLILFRSALHKLIQSAPQNMEDKIIKELVSQIKEGVAELNLSDKTATARKTLTNIGVTISSFLVTFGLKQGFDPSVSAIGIAGAALTALSQYSQIIEARGQMRKNPFYAIWSLQKGKGPKNKFSQRHYISKQTPSQNFNKNEIPLYHWLSPPTPGWNIPTAIRV